MTGKFIGLYARDPEVKHVHIDFRAENWWNDTASAAAAT